MANPRAPRSSATITINRTELRRLLDCWAAKVWRVCIRRRAGTARCGSGAVWRSAQAEVDRRNGGRFRLGLEELALQEAEHAGEEVVREDLDRVVVVQDACVVVLPAERDLVLGRRDLFLQGQDVLVGLELRVVLDDGEQGAQRRGQ